MSNNSYNTDKPYTKPVIPYYKLRKFKVMVIFAVLVSSGYFVLKEVYKEVPPKNTVYEVDYNRSTIVIRLKPQSVIEPPEFSTGKNDSGYYYIDVADSDLPYESARQYDYGNVLKIERKRMGERVSRVGVQLNNNADSPKFEYDADLPGFVFHYNKHLTGKYIVVIDAGHGGKAPGAVGKGGNKEKDAALDIALKLREVLQAKDDIEVVMTRDRDEDVSLYKRRMMSNFLDTDFFISIHANSSPNRSANHTEIYHAGRRNDNDVNQVLATEIKNELQRTLGIGRGSVRRRGFYVIRRNNTKYGAVLVETMFISNARGERMLVDESVQMKIAQGISNAIDRMILLGMDVES